MGGELTVKSKVNEGTTFTLQLSLMQKTDSFVDINSHRLNPPNKEHIEPPEGEAFEEDNFKPRILIANDDTFILQVTQNILMEFFQIEAVENGHQALQHVTTRPVTYFDAIVLDINMPIMDGFQASKLINEYF